MPKQEPNTKAEETPEVELATDEENDVPSNKEAAVVAARQEQSQASKRATFEMLKSKKRRFREITFLLSEDEPVTMMLVALGSQAYDKLVTKHPPTQDQRIEGAAYNVDTFAPALLEAVVTEPQLTTDQWKEIWTSSDWNRGEVLDLFAAAAGLCVQGLDVPLS
jgi:hypothetical protein